MSGPSLRKEDRRLLRAVTIVLFGAFSLILFLVGAGYVTEQRRVTDANNFSLLTSASSEVGTISQKVALLLFGTLGKPNDTLLLKLNDSVKSEMERFRDALKILNDTPRTDALSASTNAYLLSLSQEIPRFEETTAQLQRSTIDGVAKREVAQYFAEQTVKLLELARECAKRLGEDASRQAKRAEVLVTRYYILGGTTILATGIIVLLGLLSRLRRELGLRRHVENNLLHANQELDRFSSVVAHDLKSPLTTIALSATMLDESGSRENIELVRTIAAETNRLREMVQALLHISHGECVEIHLQPVRLSNIIEKVRDSLQVQLERWNTKLIVADDATIDGDATLLHNVFQNLVENSIKYKANNSPEITISASSDGGETLVSYEDNCVGIDQKMRERVFDPFVQSPNQKNRGGVGLGLSVVKKVITCHGGSIEIVDKEGAGTKFIMKFPSQPLSSVVEFLSMAH